MNIRRIERGDLEDCAQLYAEVFASPPWSEPWTATAALQRLSHFYESRGFIGVLAEDGNTASFALGNTEPFHAGTLFYLREMCTRSNLQSQGVGGRVFTALENELRGESVVSVYLTTERAIPAARFYGNMGFNEIEKYGFYAKGIGL